MNKTNKTPQTSPRYSVATLKCDLFGSLVVTVDLASFERFDGELLVGVEVEADTGYHMIDTDSLTDVDEDDYPGESARLRAAVILAGIEV